MHFKRRHARDDAYAAASDVARLGYCERQIALDRIHGARQTPYQRTRRREGDAAHAAFLRDAQLAGQPIDFDQAKKWCFVATMAFGQDAPETATLRRFRDTVLRRSFAGRMMVRLYYRVSPALCDRIGRYPIAVGACRVALRCCVVPIARILTRSKRCAPTL